MRRIKVQVVRLPISTAGALLRSAMLSENALRLGALPTEMRVRRMLALDKH